MKAKLLRKVRKEFTIIRHDSLDYDNIYGRLRSFSNSHGFPFYELVTGKKNSCLFKMYDDAYTYLCDVIHERYIVYSRKYVKGSSTKVWYANK